jgi:hypothetical protein
VNEERVRGQVVLCFILALVKCTRIYFSGANDVPSFLAHSKERLWTLRSVLQLSSIVLPTAKAFTSLIKLISDVGKLGRLQAWMRLALL